MGLVHLRVRQLSNLAENSRRAAFTDTSSSGVCVGTAADDTKG